MKSSSAVIFDGAKDKEVPMWFNSVTALWSRLTLRAPITTAADDTFCEIFPNLRKK